MRKLLMYLFGLIFIMIIALSTFPFAPETIQSGYKSVFRLFKSEPAQVFMVGDMMLGRYVESLQKKNGLDYPFEGISDMFDGSDVVFGNLEGPIANEHYQTPDFVSVFSFAPHTADVLAKNGFNLVTLANNHTLDRGESVYFETGQFLAKAGIDYFGHPVSASSEYVLEKEVQGKDFVFIGFHDTFLNDLNYDEALGVVSSFASDEDKFVFVSVHWGTEYKLTSNSAQQEFAHNLIDAGADLVLGHHPHVVEEIEEYKGRLIFYSLGNFIFDQYQAYNTQEGLAVKMVLDDEMRFELVPVRLLKSQPTEIVEGVDEWLLELASRGAPDLAGAVSRGVITLDWK